VQRPWQQPGQVGQRPRLAAGRGRNAGQPVVFEIGAAGLGEDLGDDPGQLCLSG
jgi:hypothetical protein